jgi:hypothetical protein
MYSFTPSYARIYVKVNGQHQAPPVPTEQEAGWGTKSVPKDKTKVSFVVQPAPSRYRHCCWDSDITTEQQLLQPHYSLTLWKRDCAGTRQLSSSSETQTKVEEWSLDKGIANVWTGFSWHRLRSDGRIVLLTFPSQLILTL